MIVSVMVLMALMMLLALVISMLDTRRADVVAALLGAPAAPHQTVGGSSGGWSARALLRA